jgi:hypothetical protein
MSNAVKGTRKMKIRGKTDTPRRFKAVCLDSKTIHTESLNACNQAI